MSLRKLPWLRLAHRGLPFLLIGLVISPVAFGRSQLRSVAVDFTKNQVAEQETNVLRTSEGIGVFRQGDPAFFLSPSQNIPISDPNPFLSIAPSAEIQHFSPSQLQIQVRFSQDGSNWGPWMEVTRFEDGPQIPQLFIGNLMYQDSTMEYFQYMVLFSSQTQSLTTPRLTNLTFDFFSPGEVTALTPGMLYQRPEPMNELTGCDCPQPGFATRTDWNCPDGQNPSCTSPEFTTTTHMVIHHSAGPNSSTNWAATVLSIWNFHVNTNGWCDIGYNWVIDPNGVIYEGRGGGNNVKGAHFCAANSGTVGICLLGNYESTAPTPEALESLRKLLAWKACDSQLNPLGTSFHPSTGKNLSVISGHRDGCATQCPGDAFMPLMSNLRTEVDTALAACQGLSSIDPQAVLASFRMYPNPVSNNLFVSWDQTTVEDRGGWSLINAQGQQVAGESRRFTPGSASVTIGTRHLTPGMYLIQIRSGKVMLRKPVLVSH